jgi:hypothetical protein
MNKLVKKSIEIMLEKDPNSITLFNAARTIEDLQSYLKITYNIVLQQTEHLAVADRKIGSLITKIEDLEDKTTKKLPFTEKI